MTGWWIYLPLILLLPIVPEPRRTQRERTNMSTSAWHDAMAPLLGKRVRVTLSHADPQVVQEGILIGFGEGGDVELLASDGMLYHAWPNLLIQELPDDAAPDKQD